MMLRNLLKFLLAALILSMFAGAFYIPWYSSSPAADKAETFYNNGVNENSIAARALNFNAALEEYSLIDAAGTENFSTGKLYYNIGNTYFQLEDYPHAILYYAKAKPLLPGSKELEINLELARSKLSLPTAKKVTWLQLFLLDPWIPLPRRLQLFSLTAILAAILASIAISKGGHWAKFGAAIFSFITAVILINLAATRYLSPIEAVVTKAAFLQQNSSDSSPKVSNQPLPTGSFVEVIELSNDGNWVKIITEEDSLGFVPAETIDLIR